MNQNDTATITIPVTVNAGVTNTTIPNTATVSNGADTASDSADLTVGTAQPPSGTISKAFNPATLPSTGGASTVTMVTNITNTATTGNTVVTDTFDSRLVPGTGVSANGFTCSTAAQTVTCTRTTAIGAGEVSTITIPVTAAAGGATGYTATNTATVSGGLTGTSNVASLGVGQTVDPNPNPTNQNADLSALKRPGTNFVQNSQAMWIGVISNAGPAPSQPNVSFGDTLPTGTTFQSGGGGGFACTAAGQQVTCTRAAPLAAGETAVVQIIVLVTAPPGTALTNTIIVNGGAFDPVLSNNTASDTQVVQSPGTPVQYFQYPYGYAYPYAQQPCYGGGGGGQQQQQEQSANAGTGTATQSGQQQQGGGGWGVNNQSQEQESVTTDKDGKTTKQSSDSSQHSVTGPPGMFGGCGGGGGNQQQQQQ